MPATTRIVACVAEKARKVRNGRRAQGFSRWWLIHEEKVVIVHDCLGEEWSGVEDGARCCEGIDQWNKAVLLGKYTGESTVVCERPDEPPLA